MLELYTGPTSIMPTGIEYACWNVKKSKLVGTQPVPTDIFLIFMKILFPLELGLGPTSIVPTSIQ